MESGWIRASFPGGIAFGGEVEREFAGIGVKGSVHGSVSSKEFEAAGSAEVDAGVASASGDALLNNRGLAGCATATIGVVVHKTVSIGGAYRWNGKTSVFSDSCGFGRLKEALAARVAATGVPVIVPAHTSQINLVVNGAGAPPKLVLTDGGVSTTVTPGTVGELGSAAYVAVADPSSGDTYVAIAGLPAGTLTVAAAPGSSAISSVGSVLPLPKPNVKIHVSAAGGRRYRLSWSSTAIPGQTLVFADVDSRGQRVVLKSSAPSGHAFFTSTPDGASGAHQLRVTVEQDGLIRQTSSLTTFTPAKPVLSRPRVTIRLSHGAAVIRWPGVREAGAYQVSIHTADGRWLYFKEPATVRSITVKQVSAIAASVSAIGPGMEVGPVGKAAARAASRRR